MDEGLRERTTLAITSRKALRDDNNPNEDNNNKITVNETTNDRPSTQQSSNNSDLLISWRRILMLIMAVTVHNFPEGLAVGIGFGSIGKTPAATFEKAFNLALGIGLQNFPEGFLFKKIISKFLIFFFRFSCFFTTCQFWIFTFSCLSLWTIKRYGRTSSCFIRIFCCSSHGSHSPLCFKFCCWSNDLCGNFKKKYFIKNLYIF